MVSVQNAFEHRQAAPWQGAYGLSAVLKQWSTQHRVSANIVLDETLPAQAAEYAEIPSQLSEAVLGALAKRGFERLYCHQAEAYELASQGRDVVVATPTASGKSLGYNLPVVDAFARRRQARALYLFPTKALSRDQEVSIRGLLKDTGLEHGAVTYDGDTPPDARRAARDRSGILITNPDMLHAGVLPHHAAWARFFSNLEFVVIDELHTYRGVLGSHLANVIRRLQRVARFHGANPQFLFSSATIGNPAEHASRLVGRPVALVNKSGAPTGPRRILMYNPPLVNPELGLRQSCLKTSVRLATDLVKAKVSTIVFGHSRNQVEVMLKYLRDALAEQKLPRGAIMAYRGGYLPEQRRAIEKGLRDGEILCVVATNALELGIDIGALQAVVCAGYPGSMASTWQRFGRGGRRQEDALAVLVTNSGPLDQYLSRTPRLLMDAPLEEARVDPDNVEILIQHLKCAAFELPFEEGEAFGDVAPEPVQDAMLFLADHRVVHPVPGRTGQTVYHWSTDAYPANDVSLRSPSWDNFVIIDVARSKTIAEMDFRSTHTMLHEQAIYQHDGAQYQVEELDYENHKAFVRKVTPDYYTTAMTHVRVSVLEQESTETLSFGTKFHLFVGHGDVDVAEKVVGFKKIKFHTHENVGFGEVNLPAVEKPTTAFWYTVGEALLQQVQAPRAVLMDALAGLLNALHAVAAVGLMMDPRDLGRTLVDEPGINQPEALTENRSFEPTLYLYDSVAGGVGLAPRLWQERQELLQRAHQLVAGCTCAQGCPSCVGPVAPHVAGDGRWSRRALVMELTAALGLRA